MKDEDVVDWGAIDEEETYKNFTRTNLTRVRGYLIACARRSKLAYEALEEATTALVEARKRAELALALVKVECDHAEEMAYLVALGDDAINDELARRLEEMGL